ncbi:rubrerythrin [Candidatus Acetothermia bacterium]|nr:MAG: rubrerythrin [Candidatus Acetothermia bacterium]
MLAKNPAELGKLGPEARDREILRLGIIAELDAINLYEQLAAVAADQGLREVLRDIAREEKTHVGEFLALLLRRDPEQREELAKGKEEIEELLG